MNTEDNKQIEDQLVENNINDPEFYFQDGDHLDFSNFDECDNDDIRLLDGINRNARKYYHKHKEKHKLTIEYKFNQLKKTSKQRGIQLSITKEDYSKFIDQNPKCYYCDNMFSCLKINGYQLDRIDNAKGYHLDNVLRCCWTCNEMRRNHYSVEEFKHIVDYLLNKRGLNCCK